MNGCGPRSSLPLIATSRRTPLQPRQRDQADAPSAPQPCCPSSSSRTGSMSSLFYPPPQLQLLGVNANYLTSPLPTQKRQDSPRQVVRSLQRRGEDQAQGRSTFGPFYTPFFFSFFFFFLFPFSPIPSFFPFLPHSSQDVRNFPSEEGIGIGKGTLTVRAQIINNNNNKQ